MVVHEVVEHRLALLAYLAVVVSSLVAHHLLDLEEEVHPSSYRQAAFP